MASRILSLVSQLESACKGMPKDEWDLQDPAIRRETCNTLRRLSAELEDPGDLVDRVVYQVNAFLAKHYSFADIWLQAYGQRLTSFSSRARHISHPG